MESTSPKASALHFVCMQLPGAAVRDQTRGCANPIQGSYAWEKNVVGGSSSSARNLLDFLQHTWSLKRGSPGTTGAAPKQSCSLHMGLTQSTSCWVQRPWFVPDQREQEPDSSFCDSKESLDNSGGAAGDNQS